MLGGVERAEILGRVMERWNSEKKESGGLAALYIYRCMSSNR